MDNIVVDKKQERWRRFFNVQYVKLKKVAPVGSMITLFLNLAFTMYPYVEHRFPHPYLGIPVVFGINLFIGLFLAHVYLNWLQMYRTEAEAEKYFNPYAVNYFGPWEEVVYRNLWIPVLEGIRDNETNPKRKEYYQRCIDRFLGWMDQGFVPKKDFPKHLLKFYKDRTQKRL